MQLALKVRVSRPPPPKQKCFERICSLSFIFTSEHIHTRDKLCSKNQLCRLQKIERGTVEMLHLIPSHASRVVLFHELLHDACAYRPPGRSLSLSLKRRLLFRLECVLAVIAWELFQLCAQVACIFWDITHPVGPSYFYALLYFIMRPSTYLAT